MGGPAVERVAWGVLRLETVALLDEAAAHRRSLGANAIHQGTIAAAQPYFKAYACGPTRQSFKAVQGQPVTVSVGQTVSVQAANRPAQTSLLHADAGQIVQARADTPSVLQPHELLGAGAVQQLRMRALGQRGESPL